jgi:hypothetical protein
MQIAKNFSTYVALTLLVLAFPVAAAAEIVEGKGAAEIAISGRKPTSEERAKALHSAKVNAVERFIARGSSSQMRMFDSKRDEIASRIDDYILSSTTLVDEFEKSSKTLTLAIRAEINQSRLESDLTQSATSGDPNEQSYIALVYVSRVKTSVQTFDDKVYKRVDTQAAHSETADVTQSNIEKEKVTRTSVAVSDESHRTANVREDATVIVTTGGSTTRKADKYQYDVSPASDIDISMTGVFAEAGFQVVTADFIPEIDLGAIRKDFGEGDDLQPATLRAMTAAVRGSDIPLVSLGTLDIGVRDTDPVSGNVRIVVTVTAQVLDLSARFPTVVSSIGPVQFAGLGPDEHVAKTNALTLAATNAAEQMIDELRTKGIH